MNEIERLARATWWRCRSLPERKDGATWESISPEYRKAWIDGLTQDLQRARLYLTEGRAFRGW